MGIYNRKVPNHYIPIHPDNIASKDWIVLLEAGTIVGGSGEKLRVAACTQERKIVAKYNIFLHRQTFLVVEGYDPRIHRLYFCPQLYKLDSEGKPAALNGEEIGKLLARSVRDSVVDRRPWYDPGESLPGDPIISLSQDKLVFESLTVHEPPVRDLAA
jgi:hypothetical protein